jgi:hypothetical protein
MFFQQLKMNVNLFIFLYTKKSIKISTVIQKEEKMFEMAKKFDFLKASYLIVCGMKREKK